ncbi:MAG: stage V sporulation protein AD [Oscillospiraceae bacterium]|nr:stage V sporulation protein AD [Oscillospiraceae bacterium]
MPERIGKYTVSFSNRPTVLGYAAVAGKKEGEGPLARYFDAIFEDTTMGEKTWEKSESALQREAFSRSLDKAGYTPSQINYIFCGDLLNQSIASTFGLREFKVPLFGQFGACSTMAQTMAMSAVFIDSGAADTCAAITSSHFCSAERQFRTPLIYGGQRPPSAQWTATAAGCAILGLAGNGVRVAAVCGGRVNDLGINDINNMGAAMAPAAADTIANFLTDTQTKPEDYDLILTGDLSQIGTDLLYDLLERQQIDIRAAHNDCGLMLYDRESQDVHAGGSGCGCSAAVVCSWLLSKMEKGELNNVLFIGTGALMSPTSSQQGETVPGIAHLVHLVKK